MVLIEEFFIFFLFLIIMVRKERNCLYASWDVVGVPKVS